MYIPHKICRVHLLQARAAYAVIPLQPYFPHLLLPASFVLQCCFFPPSSTNCGEVASSLSTASDSSDILSTFFPHSSFQNAEVHDVLVFWAGRGRRLWSSFWALGSQSSENNAGQISNAIAALHLQFAIASA